METRLINRQTMKISNLMPMHRIDNTITEIISLITLAVI